MNEQELRDYLSTLTPEQIIDVAVNLHSDAVRLREELDKATGTIRG